MTNYQLHQQKVEEAAKKPFSEVIAELESLKQLSKCYQIKAQECVRTSLPIIIDELAQHKSAENSPLVKAAIIQLKLALGYIADDTKTALAYSNYMEELDCTEDFDAE